MSDLGTDNLSLLISFEVEVRKISWESAEQKVNGQLKFLTWDSPLGNQAGLNGEKCECGSRKRKYRGLIPARSAAKAARRAGVPDHAED